MAYKRKTKDRFDIFTNWGYGWECEYSTHDRKDAVLRRKEYIENSNYRYAVRLEKHREPITEEEVQQ